MQTELLKITGMTCGSCTSKVTNALQGVSGVSNVKVSLSPGEATVQFDEHLATLHQLKSAIQGAGYDVTTDDTSQKPKGKGGCCG